MSVRLDGLFHFIARFFPMRLRFAFHEVDTVRHRPFADENSVHHESDEQRNFHTRFTEERAQTQYARAAKRAAILRKPGRLDFLADRHVPPMQRDQTEDKVNNPCRIPCFHRHRARMINVSRAEEDQSQRRNKRTKTE